MNQSLSEWGLGRHAPVDTLSKGLAKQFNLDMVEHFNGRCKNTAMPNQTKSRNVNFRNVVAFYRRLLKGLCLIESSGGEGKHRAYVFIYMTPRLEGDGFAFSVLQIPFKDSFDGVHEGLLDITITRHAMGRLVQRHGGSDSVALIEQLRRLPEEYFLALSNQLADGDYEIGTGKGVAITAVEGSAWTVVTWIDEAKLRQDQSAEIGTVKQINRGY